MHRIGSSFLVRKWDVPFTNPGVTDTTQAGWNAARRQSHADHWGGRADNGAQGAAPELGTWGENTYTRHTRKDPSRTPARGSLA